jgi:FAD:protein FMN transferase
MSGEAINSFACFGSTCSVRVIGEGARLAVAGSRRRLLAWHDRFTRFSPDSELWRLNADPRTTVPVSPIMARFAQAVVDAARWSGGLVDATLLDDLETAGYARDLDGELPLATAVALAVEDRPAGPKPSAPWRSIRVDLERGIVRRPLGLRLDSGGLVKGLVADVLAARLARHASFAVDCAGDLRLGGLPRPVHVASPFDGAVLHTFELTDCGVATSGIGRRSWLDAAGRPAHHLIDPATGRPAFTGVVQATALAPTALEAEIRAKAAVLSGPAGAAPWLAHGGVLVFEDGTVEEVPAESRSVTERPRRPTIGSRSACRP